ncbi:MAG: Ku protein, partial [Chloroflexi bacterium]|nr:Ku protein [Chloroflexota bacterium]
LITLKHADEVVAIEDLVAPGGADLNPKELEMARQLIGMLEDELELSAFHDAYREQVLKLVESKAKGGPRLKLVKPSSKKPNDDLGSALQASLKSLKKSA